MTASRAKAILIGFALVGSGTGTARADPDSHAKALSLFSQARKLIAAGDCVRAIPKLVESVQNEPSVGAELSLADCYEKSDPLQAWRQVEEAARVASDKHDVRLDVVMNRAAALAARLPTVRIVVPPASDVPGIEIHIDGVTVDSFLYLGGPIATTPGKHLVDAMASQRKWSESVDAQTGVPATVTVDLQGEKTAPQPAPLPTVAIPEPSPPLHEPEPHEKIAPRGGLRTLGFVAGGVGVAGLAVGTVGGLIALERTNKLSVACGQGGLSSCGAPAGSEDGTLSTTRTWATISTAGFIAGGALVVLGAVLVLIAPSRPSPASASLVLTPLVGSGEGGAGLSGAW